jgi:unconventional prefoldin RPB5 interactor 1
MEDNKIFKIILKDLQKLNEKKKADGMRSVKKGADNNPKVTKMDFLPSKVLDKIAKSKNEEKGEECPACGHVAKGDDSNCEMCNEPLSNLEEKRKRKKRRKKRKTRKKKQVRHDPNYDAPEGSKRDKALDRARRAYQRGDVAAAARIRRNMEKKERNKKGYKNVKRADTGIYTESELRQYLKNYILEAYEKSEYVQDLPDYERLEKLRKAGRFEKSNISKADEEEAAAHIKFMEDLRKENERKRAEIEKAQQKRLARRGSIKESKQINELNELLNDMIEEQLLDEMLNDLENHLDEKRKRKKKKKKKKGGGLSAAVKKSLDKKADRRCLTRGSVYSEFRKGLAAYLSSGSRKGMSAHQWAHARVNSANPSKSWATVKKRKTCPKKKKK